MSVLKADTFLSRLKDKILFLMSGINAGLCSLLPGREWLEQPKRTEGHWIHRVSHASLAQPHGIGTWGRMRLDHPLSCF